LIKNKKCWSDYNNITIFSPGANGLPCRNHVMQISTDPGSRSVVTSPLVSEGKLQAENADRCGVTLHYGSFCWNR